jgi:Peptidase family M1 domain
LESEVSQIMLLHKIENFLCDVFTDQIAIPDFSSGAMENWGLITYREIYLLFNESEASPANKQRLATVIAHELAHMVSATTTEGSTGCSCNVDNVRLRAAD